MKINGFNKIKQAKTEIKIKNNKFISLLQEYLKNEENNENKSILEYGIKFISEINKKL